MIKKLFMVNGIAITDDQTAKLQKYYERIIEWNQKINLTAITEYEDVIYKHFIDSSIILNNPEFINNKSASVLDMGTGAGFPGIVLAIMCPEYSFTLIDSLNKRIEFLHIIKEELQLDNVSLFHGRAEDYGRDPKFRNQYDFVVSRAVAELSVLLEYCIPFVRKDGYFISYKGKKWKEELQLSNNAVNELKAEISRTDEYEIQGEKRCLLTIRNLSLTDDKYPRRASKIKKKPLY